MFDFVKRVFLGLVHSVGAVFATNREAVAESGDGYIRYSSGDGYIRYSNGIQLCWGTATLNGPVTATNKRVYFPQAFKSGTVTVYTTHDTNAERALADVGWVSNTAFSIGTPDNSGSIVHTGWLATGRWK